MPTLLRFRGFNILMWTQDHEPSHVHAFGKGGQVAFWLHCPTGPVTLRFAKKVKVADRRALERFVNDNLSILCKAWKELHVNR